MHRREFLKLSAAVSVASALPLWSRAVFAADRPALPIPPLLAADARSQVTLTVSGNTLCYWTAVHGVSPEAATTGGLYTASSTYDTGFSPYPPTRKVLFTAKLTF